MQSRKFSYYIHKLRIAAALSCPNCERGKLFKGMFRAEKVCPYCGVRFDRSPGDGVGSVYINVAIAELTSVAGYFLLDFLFHPPLVVQLIIWVSYILLFTLFFYRHGKGLWTGLNYLMGGIYADMDCDREYTAPVQQPLQDKTHKHQ